MKGDSLLWIYASNDTVYMMPVAPGVFKDEEFPLWISFKLPQTDSLIKAEMYNGPTKEIILLTKVASPKNALDKQQFQKLAGKYYSKHLDYYWTIILHDDQKLVVKRPTLPDKVLKPGYDGDFMLETEFLKDDISTAWVKFFYNDAGDVSHFAVSSPRMMGHRLIRCNKSIFFHCHGSFLHELKHQN